MIYMRGQAADYDGWAQMGNTGWSWQDVLPYFVRSEDRPDADGRLHGAGGEWKVARQRLRWDLLDDFQSAASEMGIPRTTDFNAGDNEGAGYFEVNQKGGRRWSSARGFLKPALKRGNLRLLTGATVERIILDGRRATGVAFSCAGQELISTAGKEVLLSAGPFILPRCLNCQASAGRRSSGKPA